MSDSHRRQPTRLPRPWDSPGKNTGVGCHFLLQCMKVKSESEVAQSCLTLRDPMDCSLPGSSIHGIFQARVLEWGAIAFSIHLHEKLPKNSVLTILPSSDIWSKLESWEGSISGCLMRWSKLKKIFVLKCQLLLFYVTIRNHFSIRFWCGLYMTTGNGQLSGWTKKKLQSTSHSHILSHGHCLVVCYCSDPLQFSESPWNHYIWEVCSTNQWDALETAMPAAGTGQQKGPSSSPQQCPTTCHTTNTSKFGLNGLQILPL